VAHNIPRFAFLVISDNAREEQYQKFRTPIECLVNPKAPFVLSIPQSRAQMRDELRSNITPEIMRFEYLGSTTPVASG